MDTWDAASALILARQAQGEEPAMRMLTRMWAQAVHATFGDGPVTVSQDAFGPFERAGQVALHASHIIRGPADVAFAVESALPKIEQVDENGRRSGPGVLTAYAVDEGDHVRLDIDPDGVLQPLAAAAALRILVAELQAFEATPASVEARDG